MERVNWERVRDVLISILCVGVMLWAAWSLLGLFVHAIVLLLLAMAVAFLVTPLVDLLNRYLPRILAALLVYALVLAILAGLCYALIFSLIQQVNYFSQNLPGYVQDLPTTYANIQKWLIQQGIPQQTIDATINSINQQANALAASLANNLVSIIFVVTDAIINVLVVVVVSFYLVLDGKRIRNSIISIVPKPSMNHVLLFEDALNRVVGNYIRGQLTLAAIIGILAGAGCYMLGLKNFALIIGVLAFLFETIPMVGPALASIPAILISLLLPGPFPRTYEILIYFVIIQIFESNILGPRIVGHAVGLHPVASILALIAGAQLFGAFGALLATPIVAAFWVVIVSLYRSIRGEPADVMLARRRSSWIRRRPHEVHTRTNTAKAHLNSIPGNNGAAEHIQEVPLQIKGLATPGKIEHLDLLRHVHTQDQSPPEKEDSIE
ncbi:MAG TPA: AI-2E family transporter [Ktedonobacteraceae bacterium]|jgi:predicted PurR-regulated permease PerM|nr:AI-2E family transporter [Ktedonobacteraceae bacterium]